MPVRGRRGRRPPSRQAPPPRRTSPTQGAARRPARAARHDLRREVITASSDGQDEGADTRPVAGSGQATAGTGASASRPRRRRWLRWTAAAAALLLLAVLLAVWRLTHGPVDLNWLTPLVEAALERSAGGLKIAISGVRIDLKRPAGQLEVRAENVRISLPDGRRLAGLPELTTSFALGQLLHGRLAPTEIVLERPVLHLVRSPAGAFVAQVEPSDA